MLSPEQTASNGAAGKYSVQTATSDAAKYSRIGIVNNRVQLHTSRCLYAVFWTAYLKTHSVAFRGGKNY